MEQEIRKSNRVLGEGEEEDRGSCGCLGIGSPFLNHKVIEGGPLRADLGFARPVDSVLGRRGRQCCSGLGPSSGGACSVSNRRAPQGAAVAHCGVLEQDFGQEGLAAEGALAHHPTAVLLRCRVDDVIARDHHDVGSEGRLARLFAPELSRPDLPDAFQRRPIPVDGLGPLSGRCLVGAARRPRVAVTLVRGTTLALGAAVVQRRFELFGKVEVRLKRIRDHRRPAFRHLELPLQPYGVVTVGVLDLAETLLGLRLLKLPLVRERFEQRPTLLELGVGLAFPLIFELLHRQLILGVQLALCREDTWLRWCCRVHRLCNVEVNAVLSGRHQVWVRRLHVPPQLLVDERLVVSSNPVRQPFPAKGA
eukprot:m.209819 g.209819  ORF g.209819 m.209819 type:complete len:364 (+) comp25473_c0_seq1:85-1176(+)